MQDPDCLSPATIPVEVWQEIKCATCDSYLSVAPIMVMSNLFHCGRCKVQSTDSEETVHRAIELEGLFARLGPFPCRFDTLGCKHLGKFTEIGEHELTCEFRTIKCPSQAENCVEELHVGDVLEHFRTNHKDSVLDTSSFALVDDDNNVNVPHNFVITLDDYPFLLQTQKIEGQNCFKVTLRRLKCFSGDCNKVSFSIVAQCPSSGHNFVTIKGHKLMGYKEEKLSDNNCEDEFVKLNLEALESVLESKVITFQINIEMNRQGTLETLTLIKQHLECEICKEVMHTPIYSCDGGHSPVCCHCLLILDKCPTCEASFSGTRNFVVERLIKKLIFKCCYTKHGCAFLDNTSNIYSHEKNCTFKPIKCPHCTWTGTFNNVREHLASELHNSDAAMTVVNPSSHCFEWQAKVLPEKNNEGLILENNIIIIYNNCLFEVIINFFPYSFHCLLEQCDVTTNKESFTFQIIFKSPNHTLKSLASLEGTSNREWVDSAENCEQLVSDLVSSGSVVCTLFINPA